LLGFVHNIQYRCSTSFILEKNMMTCNNVTPTSHPVIAQNSTQKTQNIAEKPTVPSTAKREEKHNNCGEGVADSP
jgi:hypothetical protein